MLRISSHRGRVGLDVCDKDAVVAIVVVGLHLPQTCTMLSRTRPSCDAIFSV